MCKSAVLPHATLFYTCVPVHSNEAHRYSQGGTNLRTQRIPSHVVSASHPVDTTDLHAMDGYTDICHAGTSKTYNKASAYIREHVCTYVAVCPTDIKGRTGKRVQCYCSDSHIKKAQLTIAKLASPLAVAQHTTY